MRTRFLLGLLFLFGISLFAYGKEDLTLLKDDLPSQYEVKKGDTLWDISAQFLNHPWQWPEIWHNSPDIKDPHWIYPGDLIVLRYVDGSPRLMVQKRGVQKLSPTIREIDRGAALEVLPPARLIEQFLDANQIKPEAEVGNAPSVLGGLNQRLYVASGDEFYALGNLDSSRKQYGVFRKGDSYLEPSSGELLGTSLVQIGKASLVKKSDKVVILRAIESRLPFRKGDKVLTQNTSMAAKSIVTKVHEEAIDGAIIKVENNLRTAGVMDIVALNRGQASGLQSGSLLDVYEMGDFISTADIKEPIKLPDRNIGKVMIFSVYGKMSFGIILQASQQIKAGNLIRNP